MLEWLGLANTPDWRKARWLGRACGIALVVVALLVLVGGIGAMAQFLGYALVWPDDPSTSTNHEAIRNIGLVLVAVFGAPFVVWRSVVAQKQADTSEQSHITDQINKAVEALGAEKTVKRKERRVTFTLDGEEQEILTTRLTDWRDALPDGAADATAHEIVSLEETVPNTEVRIGAIYALERIAQDSLRDHVSIMEILTAYIRQNAPAKGLAPLVPEITPLQADASPEERAAHAAARTQRAVQMRRAAIGLWADTLVQAAMQVIGRRAPEQKAKEKSDTRYGKKGYRLDLRATNLRTVDISGLDLAGADLFGAHLEQADLFGAHVEGAHLDGAHLEGAHLVGAHLDASTSFTPATLRGAGLKDVDLSVAVVDHRRLEDLLKEAFGDDSVTLPKEVARPDWPEDDLDKDEFIDQWRAFQRRIGYTPPS